MRFCAESGGNAMTNETGIGPAQWYVLHTYSGYENKVAQSIMKLVEYRKLQDMIVEVQIPTEQVREITDGKEKEVTRKIFPGYVLVKMVYTDEIAYLLRTIRGMTGFVGSNPNDPVPLSEKEVAALGVDLGQAVQVNISVGDIVRIAGTAMDGFTGTVQSIDAENGICNVLVSMFGQETPTELSLSQVIRLD